MSVPVQAGDRGVPCDAGQPGRIVAFVVLGLTIDLAVIAQPGVWMPGLILGAALAFLIRPVLVGLCLLPARLKGNERNFVLFAGLKGAVPILLGSFPDRR